MENQVKSLDSLLKILIKYFNLVKKPTLTDKEIERKKIYEPQILHFLENLQWFTKNYNMSSNPYVSYNNEILNSFIKGGCIPNINTEPLTPSQKKSVEFRLKLNELMRKKGVRSADVIEQTGINQSVFSKAKVGLRPPTLSLLKELSDYFEYDLMEYL